MSTPILFDQIRRKLGNQIVPKLRASKMQPNRRYQPSETKVGASRSHGEWTHEGEYLLWLGVAWIMHEDGGEVNEWTLFDKNMTLLIVLTDDDEDETD